MENIPKGKPIILISNHQNAMLDPVILCVLTKPQLHWLTRSDVFKKGLVDKALRKLNMLPVYRERDGVDDLHGRNNAIFEICFDRLKHGAMVCMFPEGTHRGKKQLYPFKKGLARVAFGAKEHGVNDLHILPVGIDYTDYYHSGGDLLVRVGKPIALQPFVSDYESDNTRGLTLLVQAARHALSKEMIDVHPDDFYDFIMPLESHIKSMAPGQNLNAKLNYFNKFHVAYTHRSELRQTMEPLLKEYTELNQQLNIKRIAKAPEQISLMDKVALPIACSVGFALALPAMLVYYPLHITAERFIAKNIKDPLFPNSIRVVFWTFGGLLLTALVAIPVGLLLPVEYAYGCAFLGLLTSGLVAVKTIFAWRHWRRMMNVEKALNAHEELREKWLSLRKSIKEKIDNIK